MKGEISQQKLQLALRAKPELVAKFMDQLNKDMGTQKFSSGDLIDNSIADKIEAHLAAHKDDIASILYRADVSEEKVKGIVEMRDLALLIIKRIAEKVIFKDQFPAGA